MILSSSIRLQRSEKEMEERRTFCPFEEEIRDGILAGLWLVHGQIIYLTIKNGDKSKWKMY